MAFGSRCAETVEAFRTAQPSGNGAILAVSSGARTLRGRCPNCAKRTSPAFPELGTRRWRLVDVIGEATYERDASDLKARGLSFVAAPWQAAIFIFDKTGRHALPSGV
jgi:hypothetical protein